MNTCKEAKQDGEREDSATRGHGWPHNHFQQSAASERDNQDIEPAKKIEFVRLQGEALVLSGSPPNLIGSE